MTRLLILVTLAALILTGCSAGGQPAVVQVDKAKGDPEYGLDLFIKGKPGVPACSTCHARTAVSPSRARMMLGPNLAGVALRARTRVEGLSAEAYIRESILEPGKYVVPGFSNLMYGGYGDALTPEDVDNLVAFLLTLTEK